MSNNPFEEYRMPCSVTRKLEDQPNEGGSERKKHKLSVMPNLFPTGSSIVQKGLPEKLGDNPLRLIIVGHNPSSHAWDSGHYYSNPGNWMWRILISTGIAPAEVKSASDDELMLSRAAIGFTDVGSGIPGTDSSQFGSSVLESWSIGFLDRLEQHLDRANASIGCICGACGAPQIVAFAGKRQWIEVYNTGRRGKEKLKTVEIGKQTLLPLNWPFPESTEVWVLPSTSGASALTHSERKEPYRNLARVLKNYPWPENRQIQCRNESKNKN